MGRMIEGVLLHPLKRIHNPKGDIFHALKCTDCGFQGFGEVYFSQIHFDEVKGWKRHNRMSLNLVVITGKIKFVIYDDRKDSATRGEFCEIVLSPEENYQRLTVAPGLWMAFCGVDKQTSILMDLIPEPHDDSEVTRKMLSDINYPFK